MRKNFLLSCTAKLINRNIIPETVYMKKLISFFLLSTFVIAGPYEPNNIDKQIINHTFNEEFDRAIKLSQDQIKTNTGSPKY